MSREFFAETAIEICDLLQVKYFELESQIWKKYLNAFMGTKFFQEYLFLSFVCKHSKSHNGFMQSSRAQGNFFFIFFCFRL